MRSFFYYSFIALVLGIGIGWFAAGQRQDLRSEAEQDTPPPNAENVSEPLRAPDQAGSGEHEPESTRVLPERYLAEAGMRAVPKTAVDQLRIAPLRPDGTVSAQVAELLSLGDDEVARLNEVLAGAAEHLQALELEHMVVVRSEEDEVVLRISAFVEKGLAAEEALHQAILRELGEEDGEIFVNMMVNAAIVPMGGARGDYWNGFGRVDREIAFRLQPREGDPDGSLEAVMATSVDEEQRMHWFREERRQLGGGEAFFSRMRNPEMRDRVLGRYRYLVDLLPDDLRAHFTPETE